MGDIIEEEVELHLVDTTQLVKEAKKLKEAQRIKRGNDKIKKQLTFSKPSPFIQAGQAGLLPKKESKAQTRVGAIKGQNTNNEFTKMQKKIKELERKQTKIIKNEKKLRDELFENLNYGGNIISNANISGAATGILAKFGPIGIAIGGILSAALPGLFSAFERGGVFSIKLPTTQQEKTINEIEYVVDVNSGTKFLTSDLRIAQKAPDTSNTQNLRYEHVRYVSQENGK